MQQSGRNLQKYNVRTKILSGKRTRETKPANNKHQQCYIGPLFMRMCLCCNTSFCTVAKIEDLVWVSSLHWQEEEERWDKLLTLGF